MAKAVRIEKLEAHCSLCAEDNFLNIPLDQINLPCNPLKEGFAFDRYPGKNGQGILRAVCNIDKHVKRRPWIRDVVKYKFQFTEDGEFTTSNL